MEKLINGQWHEMNNSIRRADQARFRTGQKRAYVRNYVNLQRRLRGLEPLPLLDFEPSKPRVIQFTETLDKDLHLVVSDQGLKQMGCWGKSLRQQNPLQKVHAMAAMRALRRVPR